MADKEITTKENMMEILALLDSLHMRYWVDGGWGIDILTGRQNREHRDLDINFDGQFTEALLAKLKEKGYAVTTDWSPCRVELYHKELGYLDVHPLVIGEDGSAKQADPFGGWYDFEADFFACAAFEGKQIPCMSAGAQKLFHSGYELREKDRMDLKNLDAFLSEEKAAQGNE